MVLLYFLELIFVVLVLLFVGTQIVIPLWRGTLLFPVLRQEGRLESKLSDAKQRSLEAVLERQVTEEKGRMNGKGKKNKTSGQK